MRYSASGASALAASWESLLMSSECAMSSMVDVLMKDMAEAAVEVAYKPPSCSQGNLLAEGAHRI